VQTIPDNIIATIFKFKKQNNFQFFGGEKNYTTTEEGENTLKG
jgi:hypothetical protein